MANPGCFPTSVLLALIPALRRGLLDPKSIRISGMTGISGGGRTARPEFHFPECNENITAYKVVMHQHESEMEQELSKMAGEPVKVVFVPHLAPMIRGIYSTIFAQLRSSASQHELQAIYQDDYGDEPFIRLMPYGIPPQIKHVASTNFCDIGYKLCDHSLILMSAIDNLCKGASGQAVQNMNIICGFTETAGLM